MATMTTRRPTIGNTVAIDRFNHDGPQGYAAVYDDGTHGPTRATRAEAEQDYQNNRYENSKHLTPGREHIELGDELELYAMNTSSIYPRRSAIERVAQKRYDRLSADPEAEKVPDRVFNAIRPMVISWLDMAISEYSREWAFGMSHPFTDKAKEYAADSIAVSIIQEVQLGNFRD